MRGVGCGVGQQPQPQVNLQSPSRTTNMSFQIASLPPDAIPYSPGQASSVLAQAGKSTAVLPASHGAMVPYYSRGGVDGGFRGRWRPLRDVGAFEVLEVVAVQVVVAHPHGVRHHTCEPVRKPQVSETGVSYAHRLG